MTTNKISFISVMFVVGITYLSTMVMLNFNLLDFTYLLFIIVSFLRFIYIRKIQKNEGWQTSFFSL